MAARILKVDVTSDTLCPFCILGVKQLQTAIAQFGKTHAPLDVKLALHPFQLRKDAELPNPPITRREWSEQRFGKERYKSVSANLAKSFSDVGLTFNQDSIIGSSHPSHRLEEYTLKHYPEKQPALAMDVFSNYHEAGNQPGDKDKLSEIAVKHGVFPSIAAARSWLAGNELDTEVKKQYDQARAQGISGVPFFVFNDKFAESGAVGVEGFTKILEHMFPDSK